MARSILYVAPLELDANPAIDAIAQGLQHALHGAGIELRVLFADFRASDHRTRYAEAIEAGIAAGVAGIAIYALDPTAFGAPVAAARAAGIPVFSFARPHYPVNGSVVYPNFNHGVFMAEHLAALLPAGSGVAVIGGPDTVDDSEEVAGLVYALERSHCRLLNRPEEEPYQNTLDVAAGGREPTLRILGEFPDLRGLIPYNDTTMLGALGALEELGRLGELEIVSRNGSADAVAAVRDRKSSGTWDLDASGIGTTLGDLIVRHLKSEALEQCLVMGPVGRMITRDNLESWRPWSERISWAPLSVGL